MATADADFPLSELATIYEGLAHPARVAILRALRAQKRLAMAELRKVVSDAHVEIDARTLQFHASKMQLAGLVSIRRVDGRDVAELVRDVSVRVRPVLG